MFCAKWIDCVAIRIIRKKINNKTTQMIYRLNMVTLNFSVVIRSLNEIAIIPHHLELRRFGVSFFLSFVYVSVFYGFLGNWNVHAICQWNLPCGQNVHKVLHQIVDSLFIIQMSMRFLCLFYDGIDTRKHHLYV